MSDATGPTSTVIVQRLLDMLHAGDPNAPQQLLDVSTQRLRHLSRKILSDIPGVKRWEDTDDLLQNGSIRLWKALEKHHPPTTLDYFRLAAAVIRRELIDLSRHYFGPEGMGTNLLRSGNVAPDDGFRRAEQASDESHEPQELGRWTEFHEYIEGLPDEDRTLFDLLWYQGLTLGEAAELTGISERTIRRRWKSARVQVYQRLLAD